MIRVVPQPIEDPEMKRVTTLVHATDNITDAITTHPRITLLRRFGSVHTWTTPTRIRALSVIILPIVVGVGTIVGTAVSDLRAGLDNIGHRAGSEVVATSDLYFALNDMDAQIANVLLVGGEQNLGVGRDKALALYERRREQADADLQQAAAVAGDDPATGRALRSLLDGFGRYEALTAGAVLVDGETPHPVGEPRAGALAQYRQATDLLKSDVLPAADNLINANRTVVDRAYSAQRSHVRTAWVSVIVLGIPLIGVLLGLQVFFARRFRRLVNPPIAIATIIVAALVIAGMSLLSDEAHQLTVAKKDAFDSVLALSRARAVSYDANADESRYLVDPGRAARYQDSFLARSRQLADIPGLAGIGAYDSALAEAISAYQARHDVRFGGLFGTAFRNITFAGERDAAERTLLSYQTYQRDDRRLRALVEGGRLRDAVQFNTSYAPGNSNHDFDQYDNALQSWIALNQASFDKAIHNGEGELRGWSTGVITAVVLVVLFLLAGVRPRLAEYR